MKLKEVAVISGKPGLYQILKPTRNGVIIEAIGGGRSKIMADASHRISILKEISIYTTTEEGSVPLQDVFHKMYEKFALKIDIKTSDNNALKNLLSEVLPEWDKDRVYTSDIKKLVMWYEILTQHAPELIDPAQKEEDEEEVVASQTESEEESKVDENSEEEKLKKKIAPNKTVKPSAQTQKPSSKAATKAVKGKRGDR